MDTDPPSWAASDLGRSQTAPREARTDRSNWRLERNMGSSVVGGAVDLDLQLQSEMGGRIAQDLNLPEGDMHTLSLARCPVELAHEMSALASR